MVVSDPLPLNYFCKLMMMMTIMEGHLIWFTKTCLDYFISSQVRMMYYILEKHQMETNSKEITVRWIQSIITESIYWRRLHSKKWIFGDVIGVTWKTEVDNMTLYGRSPRSSIIT